MSSVFDRFPSPQDLLSRPVLRRLTQTLDRQIVTGRVKQYLGELRSQLEQASSDARLPSLTGLAERIARWIAEREQLGPRVVINATGNLFHQQLTHAPMAEAACTAMASTALAGAYEEPPGHASLEATCERLAGLTGAEAACVCNSLSAALAWVFSSQFAGQRVLVRRGDVVELADGLRLSSLAEQYRIELAEVGAANRVRLADFTAALETEAAAWLRIGTAGLESGDTAAEIRTIRSQAASGLLVVEVLTQAAMNDWSQFGLSGMPVVKDRLAAGIDLVLLPGDRHLGGPAVGIAAGKRAVVESLRASKEHFALAMDPVRAAGLAAALRMYDDPASVAEKHPLLALLTASPENLRNRAGRIAPQLAALAGVKECTVVEAEARQTPTGAGSVAVPTFQVKMVPDTLAVETLCQQLATHPQFSVLPLEQSEALVFDLRSVPPRYDAELVARVCEAFVNEQSQGGSG